MEESGMMPVFSILLATVTNRAPLFSLLYDEIRRQSEGKPVEIIVACDSKEISIGKKRQNLLESASGTHIAFVDDDDWISGTYVNDILTALESGPDCVGFKIECTMNGGRPESAVTSMKYKEWGDNIDGFRYTRSIYHKSPVLRSIALKVGFPNLRYCEDRPYSEGVMHHVKTESFIDKVLYFYRFRSENFAEKYGIKNYKEPDVPREVPYKKGVIVNHVRRPFHR